MSETKRDYLLDPRGGKKRDKFKRGKSLLVGGELNKSTCKEVYQAPLVGKGVPTQKFNGLSTSPRKKPKSPGGRKTNGREKR